MQDSRADYRWAEKDDDKSENSRRCSEGRTKSEGSQKMKMSKLNRREGVQIRLLPSTHLLASWPKTHENYM